MRFRQLFDKEAMVVRAREQLGDADASDGRPDDGTRSQSDAPELGTASSLEKEAEGEGEKVYDRLGREYDQWDTGVSSLSSHL